VVPGHFARGQGYRIFERFYAMRCLILVEEQVYAPDSVVSADPDAPIGAGLAEPPGEKARGLAFPTSASASASASAATRTRGQAPRIVRTPARPRLLAHATPSSHLRPPQLPIQRPRQTRRRELEVRDAAAAQACRGGRGVQQQRPERQQPAAPRGACDLGDLAPQVFDLVLAQLAERMRSGKHAHGAVVGGAVVEVHPNRDHAGQDLRRRLHMDDAVLHRRHP